MGAAPPSGRQYRIAADGYQATVVEVGAGLRELTFGDRPLVEGYGEDEMCPSGRGQLLIPWPNRIDAGRYHFGDQELRLAVTEPARNCAIHGLARWANWSPVEAARPSTSVALRLRLHGQPGWAFVLDLSAVYALSGAGLEVTVSVAAPWPSSP